MSVNRSAALAAVLAVMGLSASNALAQSEAIFLTVPASTVGVHLEFANTAGTGGFTEFSMFGVATHADWSPPAPPELHTLVIVFEWRIAGGVIHDSTNWGQSPDMITTVIGGMPNPFATGTFITPGAWDTVAVHFYAGFPITVSATFDHAWTPVPAPGALTMLVVAAALGAGRRRR